MDPSVTVFLVPKNRKDIKWLVSSSGKLANGIM
jgi:hypothetical protein